jgi:peptide/nickel transport system substrate-binding protein
MAKSANGGGDGLIWDRLGPVGRRRFSLQAIKLGLGAAAAPALVQALAACAPAAGGGKKLTWSRGDDLRTQDPQQISGLMESTINRCTYDGLLDSDAEGKMVNVLATEYTMASDGLSYTFKLRPGVKFHDGSDFNADAVVYTYERLLKNPTFQHASAFKDQLAKITPIDPMTVKFELSKPNPGLVTSFNEPILSPAAEKKYGAEFYKQIGGTGPFKYKTWTANQQWVGDANKEYWVKDLVKVDQIVFRPIAEEATRIAALQNGEVDVIDSLSGDQAEQLSKDGNIQIVRSPGASLLAITFNVRKDPFKSKDARYAVSYAIDRENIVKNITKLGKNVGATIPPGTVGYDEKLFGSPIPFDMGKAKEMFQTAKLQAGTKVSFKMNPAWFPRLKETGEYIAGQLRTLGFDVDLQFLEPGAYTEARKSGQFDIAIQEVGRAQNPGPNYQVIILDETFGNFYKEINPGIVPLIQASIAELDPAKRDAAYKKVQQAIYDDNVEFPIYFREHIWGVRKRVTGFPGRTGGDTRVYACGVT